MNNELKIMVSEVREYYKIGENIVGLLPVKSIINLHDKIPKPSNIYDFLGKDCIVQTSDGVMGIESIEYGSKSTLEPILSIKLLNGRVIKEKDITTQIFRVYVNFEANHVCHEIDFDGYREVWNKRGGM